MARGGTIKGITIELGVDSSKFVDSFKKLKSTVNDTASSLRDINKLLKLDPTNTTLLKQKQTELGRSIEETKKKIQLEKDALAKLKEGDQTPEVIRQQEALQREIIEDERRLKSLEKEFKSFGSVAKQQMIAVGEQVQQVGRNISAFGDNMAATGRSMTMKVTAPIVAGFGAAVKATAEFDSEMSKVQALTGKIDASGLENLTRVADEMGIAYSENADMSAQALEILRNKARQVAAETQYDANEVAEAYSYMALAGWDSAEMMEGISGVMDLAAASGEELGRVSDIVTDGLTAFGYSAQDTQRFVDVLAQTMSKSNTTVDMMGEAFKYVAPVAGSLGYSVEDVSLALGLMANSGIKASTAGTTLRNILTNMAKPTDEMQTAMNRLGIELEDGEGGLLSFGELLDNMREGFSGLMIPAEEFESKLSNLDDALDSGAISQKEYDEGLDELIQLSFGAEGAVKAQTAAMLAGKRGMSGLLAIVNSSDEEYNALKESIMGSTGAAEEMRKVMMDNLGGDLKVFKSNLKELGIQLADIMIPTLRKVVERGTALVKWLQNLNPKTQETIVKIAAVAAAIGPVLVVVGTLISVIGKVVTGVGSLIQVLAGLASPIGIVVVAIGALVAAFTYLYTSNEEFRNKVNEVFEAVREKITAVIEQLKVIFESFKELCAAIWAEWGDSIMTTVQTIFGAIADVISGVLTAVQGIIQTVLAVIQGDWQEAWNGIRTILSGVLQACQGIVVAVFTAIKSTITVTLEIIRSVVTTIFNGIRAVISSVLNACKSVVSSIFNSIKSTISNVLNACKSVVSSTFNNIKSTITNSLNSVKSTATSILNSLKSTFTSVFDGIKSHVSGVVNWLKKCFDFKWELPKIKLPHFSISGGFSLNPPSIPSFSVDWYKKAYGKALAFTSPTVMPTPSGFKGFGDGNGAEIVIGENKLLSSINKAAGAAETSAKLDLVTELLVEYLPELANTKIYMDKNVLVGEIAPTMNRQLGIAYRG